MVSAAEILEIEDAVQPGGAAGMARTPQSLPPIAPPHQLAFQPEHFFLGRTEGAGVVRDPFGRISRRCHVTTVGEASAGSGAIRFEEVFAYDDGEVDVWRWAMSPGREGRYVAAEALAGVGLTGQRRGGDYLISFRRPVGRATGALAPRFHTRFTLLSPQMALKQAQVSLFGLPLGRLTAIHRRVED